MIMDLTADTLDAVRNPVLRAHAARYVDIHADFMRAVSATGIEIDTTDYSAEIAARLERLRALDIQFENNGKSVYANSLSPACVACRQGVGSATFFISLQCHRHCFFCFNPNQEDYDYFTTHQRNLPDELEALRRSGHRVHCLGLTGGEPLLHRREAVEFFRSARQKFPGAHTRLYTTGDHLTTSLAQELAEAGLDEIRFSIRLDDLARGHRHTFDRIALARPLIGSVVVEMPVLPGSLAVMQDVLLELDRLGVDSINLLELCYPWRQAEAFRQRGYKVKARPFRVLYNYWYAGGLPVARSELDCLDLLAFARERGLRLGVHYCSLENKHTGQIYQQNAGGRADPTYHFSPHDYYLKTVKVFGPDIRAARRALRHAPAERWRRMPEQDCLEVHAAQVPALRGLGLECGLSYNVREARPEGLVLRELHLALVHPETFDLGQDL